MGVERHANNYNCVNQQNSDYSKYKIIDFPLALYIWYDQYYCRHWSIDVINIFNNMYYTFIYMYVENIIYLLLECEDNIPGLSDIIRDHLMI